MSKETTLDEFCEALLTESYEYCKALFDTFDLKKINKRDDKYDDTPLISAVRSVSNKIHKKDAAVKLYLLLPHLNVDATNSHKSTALHFAARYGNNELCEILHGWKADILSVNKSLETPIHKAFANDHSSTAVWLFNRLSEFEKKRFVKTTDNLGNTILHKVLKHDSQIEFTKSILPYCENYMESRNNMGQTPLLCAAYHNSCDSMVELLKNGASVMAEVADIRLNMQWQDDLDKRHNPYFRFATIIHLANTESLECLFDMECELPSINSNDNDYGCAPMHSAVMSKDFKKAKFLIEHGADITITNKEGLTAAHLAVIEGTIDIFRMLISVNKHLLLKQDKYGMTPLHWAILKWEGEYDKSIILLTLWLVSKYKLYEALLSKKVTAPSVMVTQAEYKIKGCNFEDLFNRYTAFKNKEVTIEKLIDRGELFEKSLTPIKQLMPNLLFDNQDKGSQNLKLIVEEQANVSNTNVHLINSDFLKFTKESKAMKKDSLDIVGFYHDFHDVQPLKALVLSPVKAYLKILDRSPQECVSYEHRDSLFCTAILRYNDATGKEGEAEETLKDLLKDYLRKYKRFSDEISICTEEHNMTLLHFVASKGCHDVYTYLSGEGFDKAPKQGFTPRHLALMLGHQEFLVKEITHPNFQLLNSHIKLGGVDVLLNDLHIAIMTGSHDIVKLLFQKCKNIPSTVPKLGNVLHLACLFHQDAIIPFLAQQCYQSDKGVKELLNEVEIYSQMKPLALAAHLGQYEIVRYFLGVLASDVSIADNRELYRQGFYRAACGGHNGVVKLFFYMGFTPKATDKEYDETIIMISTSKKDTYNIIKSMLSNEFKLQYEKPVPKTQVYKNLVFSGGGMKGAIYPYVLKALFKACESRKTYGKEKWNTQEEKTEHLGLDSVKRVIGTSAGAIFALGCALQSDAEKLIGEIEYDFSDFLDTQELKDLASKLPTEDKPGLTQLTSWLEEGNDNINECYKLATEMQKDYGNMHGESVVWHPLLAANLIKTALKLKSKLPEIFQELKKLDKDFKGLSEGQAIHKWLIEFMKRQDVKDPETFTFGDLAELVKSSPEAYRHLYITVTCLETKAPYTLSSEFSGANPYANYVILSVVEASMAIPFVFSPKRLCQLTNNEEKLWSEYHYVDGGLLRNRPITEFDKKLFTDPGALGNVHHMERNMSTLGFKFKGTSSNDYPEAPTIRDFALNLLKIYFDAETIIQQCEDHEYGRMIELDTGKIGTLNFKKLSDQEHVILKRNAAQSIKRYFYPEEKAIAQKMCDWKNRFFQSEGDSWESDDENDENDENVEMIAIEGKGKEEETEVQEKKF